MESDVAALQAQLQKIALGEKAAMAAFYDATLEKCYGLAIRIMRDRSIAEDVIAETYLQVWQDASKYSAKRGTPMAWLLTICRSRAIDMLRASDQAFTHPSPNDLQQQALNHDDPLALVAMMERNSTLRQALESLADEPRQVISLAFFRGMTHEEIAKHLALPLGTVKSHIRRGQQRMHDALRATDDASSAQAWSN